MNAPIETNASPSVTDAIRTRRSVREFLPDPVPQDVIREILHVASRAASGGNLQPWLLHVLTGDARDALVDRVAAKMETTPFGDGPEYDIYPKDLTRPYTTRRGQVAGAMYELLGIAREDGPARAKQMARNFEFFGAPVGMILCIDRQMGPPQFADLGLFLGNVMLLARERGLHTCPQEAWSMWGRTIREVTGIGDDVLVFCGLALGYADPSAAVNELVTDRAGIDEFVQFQGG